MIGRLFPPTWVRYRVNIGKADRHSNDAGESWLASVKLSPPIGWRRALMVPLIEYLIAEVKYDDVDEWYSSKWVTGDVSERELRADGARTVLYTLISRLGHYGNWNITDQYEQEQKFKTLPQRITLRMVYSLDRHIADQRVFTVVTTGQPKQEIEIE
ncbi:hypothetical protein ACFLWE_00085 [Chloroflexota bacterium]